MTSTVMMAVGAGGGQGEGVKTQPGSSCGVLQANSTWLA